MREWLDAIVSRDTCTCNERIGLTALVIADAALEAHVQGRPIFPVAQHKSEVAQGSPLASTRLHN
jgi:hypothetical protein